MALVRCVGCKSDTELGKELHCPLCHSNYPKGTQHTCPVLDEAVAAGNEPEPSTIPGRFARPHVCFGDYGKNQIKPSRSLWPAAQYHPQMIPSGE
jgi:hypothetical protein